MISHHLSAMLTQLKKTIFANCSLTYRGEFDFFFFFNYSFTLYRIKFWLLYLNPLTPRTMLCLLWSWSSPNACVLSGQGWFPSAGMWALFLRDLALESHSQRGRARHLWRGPNSAWTGLVEVALRWKGKSNSSCFPGREQARTQKCLPTDRKQKPTWRIVSSAVLSRPHCQGMWSYGSQNQGTSFSVFLLSSLAVTSHWHPTVLAFMLRRFWGPPSQSHPSVPVAAEPLLVHLAWPVFSTCVVLANFRHQ